jgi:hypothetical protein
MSRNWNGKRTVSAAVKKKCDLFFSAAIEGGNFFFVCVVLGCQLIFLSIIVPVPAFYPPPPAVFIISTRMGNASGMHFFYLKDGVVLGFLLGLFLFWRSSQWSRHHSLLGAVVEWIPEKLCIGMAPASPFLLATVLWRMARAAWSPQWKVLATVSLLRCVYHPPSFLRNFARRLYGTNSAQFRSSSAPQDGWVGAGAHGTFPELPKNAMYLIMPHGCSVAPSGYLSALLYRQHGVEVTGVGIPAITWIPAMAFGVNLLCRLISNRPSEVRAALEDDRALPLVLYPGGVKEMFENSVRSDTVNVVLPHAKRRLLQWAVELGVDVVPVVATNESHRVSHYAWVVAGCRWINRFLPVGIPIPPLSTDVSSPLRMIVGKVISGSPDATSLSQAILSQLENDVAPILASGGQTLRIITESNVKATN